MEHPLLSIQNVSKLFGSNYALKNVTFHVKRAECLAVVGENGAGKSTLMKILSGVWPYESYEGHILLQGRLLQLKSPMDGWKNGISIIHQELCLFPELTVAENIFLLEEFPYQGEPSKRLWRAIHWKTMTDQAEKLFAELGFSLDPHTTVRKLSVAGRQLVEIARAFHHRAKLVILDEPTSALSSTEISQLFEIIRRMSSSLSFIYISHKLDEIFTLCQRIVILRDGHSVAECDTEKVSPNEIVHHMVGRAVQFTKRATTLGLANPILSLSNLCHRSRFGKKILDQISFNLQPGEIIGIAGLMGSGRSELLRSIIGMLPGQRNGEVRLNGALTHWTGISSAMASGVGFVPEDRKKEGLFLTHTVGFNLTLSILKKMTNKMGAILKERENEKIHELFRALSIKCESSHVSARRLSGGNQQKVLLAKVLASHPSILFLDEPTRGIDVGAKEEIYELIRGLAKEGLAILLVSSELNEILALSDRVVVLRGGEMVADLENENLEQEKILAYAAGV